MTTKRFSGRHAAAILFAFFGIVIAVNVTMAMFATRTFGGTVVDNSYVASQKYNGWLAKARQQKQLGWAASPSLDAGRRVVVDLNVEGVRIEGYAQHPLGRERSIPLSFGKGQRSAERLPVGRWAVHLIVRKGQDEVRVVETIS
jgi:nitrogen fixation protein FixH